MKNTTILKQAFLFRPLPNLMSFYGNGNRTRQEFLSHGYQRFINQFQKLEQLTSRLPLRHSDDVSHAQGCDMESWGYISQSKILGLFGEAGTVVFCVVFGKYRGFAITP
jgi:hypothetical protein